MVQYSGMCPRQVINGLTEVPLEIDIQFGSRWEGGYEILIVIILRVTGGNEILKFCVYRPLYFYDRLGVGLYASHIVYSTGSRVL